MKILTAVGNEKFVKEISKLDKYEYVCSDILYQDGIFEVLKEKEIDLLILSDNILEIVTFKEFILKLIRTYPKIEIIIFLKNRNSEIENFLMGNRIYKIYDFKEECFIKVIDNLKSKIDGISNVMKKTAELREFILNNKP